MTVGALRSLQSCGSSESAPGGTPVTTHRAGLRPLREDIQALRAVAVICVLLTHLYPTQFAGGFIGVDIFFVISGFLITQHLLRELNSTGRIRLTKFYARRIRRLLPAAYTVLLASVLGVVTLMPVFNWYRNLGESAFSAFYVENLWLAHRAVNYHERELGVTVARHYWSLSVEEQFYLLWPLTLLLLYIFVRWLLRAKTRLRNETSPLVTVSGGHLGTAHRLAIAFGIATIGVASFVFTLRYVAHAPHEAYFFTPTRMWEFAGGGLIAALSPFHRVPQTSGSRLAAGTLFYGAGKALRGLLALAGWIGIGVSVYLTNPQLPFPGYITLVPVFSTMAIITAASDDTPLRWLYRPLRWPGDASYSLYLWHWPLIVIAPYVWGSLPSWLLQVTVLSLTIVLAGLTRRYVELPAQRRSLSVRRTFTLTVSAMVVFGAICASLVWISYWQMDNIYRREAVALTQECAGPKALLESRCRDHINDPVRESSVTRNSSYASLPANCVRIHQEEGSQPGQVRCNSNGKRKVALVGDSHSQQWLPAVASLASKYDWVVDNFYMSGCPAAFVTYPPDNSQRLKQCQAATDVYAKQLTDYDLILTTFYISQEVANDGSGGTQFDQYRAGLVQLWQHWEQAKVLVINDTPRNYPLRSIECLTYNLGSPQNCALKRDLALGEQLLKQIGTEVQSTKLQVFDATDAFCDEDLCYGAVGGTLVYYDTTHVQGIYTLALEPLLQSRLAELGWL